MVIVSIVRVWGIGIRNLQRICCRGLCLVGEMLRPGCICMSELRGAVYSKDHVHVKKDRNSM